MISYTILKLPLGCYRNLVFVGGKNMKTQIMGQKNAKIFQKKLRKDIVTWYLIEINSHIFWLYGVKFFLIRLYHIFWYALHMPQDWIHNYFKYIIIVRSVSCVVKELKQSKSNCRRHLEQLTIILLKLVHFKWYSAL